MIANFKTTITVEMSTYEATRLIEIHQVKGTDLDGVTATLLDQLVEQLTVLRRQTAVVA